MENETYREQFYVRVYIFFYVLFCSNVKMEEKSKKTVRMYCDICEEFDVHETEDCPVQASEPDQNSKHGAVRGSERPYCDACEGMLMLNVIFVRTMRLVARE